MTAISTLRRLTQDVVARAASRGRPVQARRPSFEVWLIISVLALLATLAGCSRSAKSHMARGGAQLAKGHVDAAALELRRAVEKDPMLGQARLKLAEAYLRQGNARGALAESVRAADLLPKDAGAQLKAGSMLLAAGRWQDARSRADKVLALDSKNADALTLRASALAGLGDLDGATEQIQKAIALAPTADRRANLGVLLAAKGRTAEAESVFRAAVASDPRSASARLALAKFLSATGRSEEAETFFKSAIAIDPASVPANQAIAGFYIAAKRTPEAEAYLRKVVDVSRDPGASLVLAEYYVGIRRNADALAVLDKLSQTPRGWAVARSRMAVLLSAEGRSADAFRAIDEVIAKRPSFAEARVVRGRLFLTAGKPDQALADAEQAVKLNPRHVEAHYLLGSVRQARRDFDAAAASFNEVLRLEPQAAGAELELAKIELQRRHLGAATQLAEQASHHTPRSLQAQLVLARGLLERGELDRAAALTRGLVAAFPQAGTVHAQAGMLAARQGDRAGAQAAFEKALELDPLLIEPLAGLVALDQARGQKGRARARVEERLKKTPGNSAVLVLAARTCGAAGERSKSEEFLRRAIDADAGNFEAYALLGELYVSEQRLDEALREFDQLAARRPGAIGPRTMAGLILEAQGKPDEARRRYERLVEAEPRAAVASNNLAWMYAGRGEQLDRALQLAQAATGQLPDDPIVNDTLGFVYIKRQLPSLAIAPLRHAVEKAPGNPVYHFHLGLAYAGAGQKPAARHALEEALRLKADFEGSDQARSLLRTLG